MSLELVPSLTANGLIEHMLDFGMNNRAKASQLSCGQTTQATKLVPSLTNLRQ